MEVSCVFVLRRHFYFSGSRAVGVAFNVLLDKPWSQLPSLLPPGTCPSLFFFVQRVHRSALSARRLPSNSGNYLILTSRFFGEGSRL